MVKRYLVWVQIEEQEIDGEDGACVSSVGEERCAGAFESLEKAEGHVERILEFSGDHRTRYFEDEMV